MLSLLANIALRLLLAGLTATGAWWLLKPYGYGALGIIASSVVFAALLAKPLIELAGEALHLLRRGAYADVEGQHYVYRNTPVRVHEDDDLRRYLRLADLRAVLGGGSSDAALARLYDAGLIRVGARRQLYLAADCVVRHLERDTRSEAARLRQWVEREVLKPSQVRQARRAAPSSPPPRPPGDGGSADTQPPRDAGATPGTG